MLLPNEVLHQKHGFEFLTYFKKGQLDQPLIVFFPGWAHLARIAYGGGDIPSEESLAYAFQEQGYSFLAISYPLENRVYSTIYPQLQMRDWAQGCASITQEIFYQFPHPYLIAIHWSASGNLMTCFKSAVQSLGLPHPFSVSLEATPPILILSELMQIPEILDNGLASIKKLYPHWLQQINTMLGKELDPKHYQETFLGAIPVGLLGTSHVYREGKIESDLAFSIKDRQAFDYAKSPLVITISGNAQESPYHPLVDRSTWSFINERKIYHGYLSLLSSKLNALSDHEWDKLCNLVKTFSQKMIYSIKGNHFLFIGRQRAQEIVEIIQKGDKEIVEFQKTFAHLLNIDIARLSA
jgi:hypothetical protein